MMRDLAQREKGIDAGLHSLLLEMMAMDSEKHARLLQFVQQRLEQRAHHRWPIGLICSSYQRSTSGNQPRNMTAPDCPGGGLKPMKSVVIYDSQYGNTQALAEAIAAELKMAGAVEVENARTGTVELPSDLVLLVVGGPTQAHGMTRPLRTQLDSLASHRLDGVAAATFDTRACARARARAWARAILRQV